MKGEVELPADRETVWAKLNDPEVLKVCIPGCQSLESVKVRRCMGAGTVATGKILTVRRFESVRYVLASISATGLTLRKHQTDIQLLQTYH